MDQKCTIYRTANFIGKRWTMLILLELSKNNPTTKGFLKLKDGLPKITSKILSSRLKELEQEGLIIKKIDLAHFPKKSEYSITASGKEFLHVIKELKCWSLKWKVHDDTCEQMNCQNCQI